MQYVNVIINPLKYQPMAVFTFTYIVLGAILKLLFYLVYGICMAVFYIVFFAIWSIRGLYRWHRARKLRRC